MRRLSPLALSLALVYAQTPAPPSEPTSPPTLPAAQEERRVEWKEIAVLLEEEQGTVWLYIPQFLQKPLAETLRRRVELKRPTVLLFPLVDLQDPDSYSAYFLYSQLFRPNLKIRFLQLPDSKRGREAILLTGKRKAYLISRDLEVKEAKEPERFFSWWRVAWERSERVDPLAHARQAFLQGVREVFR